MNASSELSEVIGSAAARSKPAGGNGGLVSFLSANGAQNAKVTFASCRGGTQQIYNRLNQSRVQRATDLVVFIFDTDDNLPNVIEYIQDTFKGDHHSRPPSGPIALAQEDSIGNWKIKFIVGRQITPASEIVREAHGAELITIQSPTPGRRAYAGSIDLITLETLDQALTNEHLHFPTTLLISIISALRSGKHLLLTGPPGTGKTSLALAIGKVAADYSVAREPVLITGTADWSSVETVGAYRMTRSNDLAFERGHVLNAMAEERWLVIDELNRADIDKAIGQLFTVLSGHAVTLPFQETVHGSEGEVSNDAYVSVVPADMDAPEETSPIFVPENWRLIATMNDRDQDLLFTLSEALMRRFAVVRVDPPSESDWKSILAEHGQTGSASWDAQLLAVVGGLDRAGRPLGPAVILDCARHLAATRSVAAEAAVELDEDGAFRSAWDLYIQPQLRSGFGAALEDLRDTVLNVTLHRASTSPSEVDRAFAPQTDSARV